MNQQLTPKENNPLVIHGKVELSPLLLKHCKQLTKPNISAEDALTVCQGYLDGVDIRQIKKIKGRAEYDSVEGYLNEIPSEAMARVADMALRLVSGERWSSLYGGQAYNFWCWMGSRYPVLQLLYAEVERLRGQARASKALDTLDTIAEEAEQDGARVKACELTLRAHHKAFGAKTEAKEGNSRPIIVVNIASIFGENGTNSPQINSADVLDA